MIGVQQARKKSAKTVVTAREGFQPTTLFTPKGVKIELMTSAQYLQNSGFSCSLFSPFSALSLAAIAPFCAPLNHFYQLLRLDCVFKFICTFQLWPNPFEIERFHQNLLPLGLHQVEQQRSEIGFETQTLGIFLVFKHNSFGVETNHHINILPFQFTLIVSLYF